MQVDADRALADIIAAVGRADRPRAIALGVEALARGLRHPLVLLLVAEHSEDAGRVDEALALLRQASEAAPDASEVWRRYGRLLIRTGALAEGLAALEEALDIDPDLCPALVDAGAASYRLADLAGAEGYYRRALALPGGEIEALSGLAAIAARHEDFSGARDLAGRALEKDARSFTAHLAIARSDFHQGAPEAAEARLTALLARKDIPNETLTGILDLRADVRDALDRPADAFADYSARNAVLQRTYAPRVMTEVRERRADRAIRLAGELAATPGAAWAGVSADGPQGADRRAGHAFLIGFPRSGTTLLEKALAGHPDVVTLEEVDHLEAAAGHLLDPGAGIPRLASLSPVEAAQCRTTYWRGVEQTLGADRAGRIVVDKLPLHTANLPLIATLFPEARIVFALRDPRDVVFSCFRRMFRMNAGMFEFLTLEGAARYYDAVMSIAEATRRLAPLHLAEVRHESVVVDFDAEASRILEFIGADWHPAVRDFAARAKAALRTPSDPQVARGLNAKGVGQWRRYEAQLQPVLGLLAPWIARFGYPED